MSSLLEQAIVDASALRDAAIKNAETAILNKYSTDIREAVEALLEQDEEQGEELSASLEDTIPLALEPQAASTAGEIVLSMEELKDMADALAAEDEALVGEPSSHEDLTNSVDAVTDGPPAPRPDADDVAAVPVTATLEEEVEIEDLEDLLEELVVDITPQKSGWAGTPEPIMMYKTELELAHRAATKTKEEIEALTKAGERLSEDNASLKSKNKKMLHALQALKENFDKINLSNARLVYTNRILTTGSLNERQKEKIVEALSKAGSIEEAKVIFETLESAVGGVTGKAPPQSLRETIERPSATLPRRAPKTEHVPAISRMQVLAGIKDK